MRKRSFLDGGAPGSGPPPVPAKPPLKPPAPATPSLPAPAPASGGGFDLHGALGHIPAFGQALQGVSQGVQQAASSPLRPGFEALQTAHQSGDHFGMYQAAMGLHEQATTPQLQDQLRTTLSAHPGGQSLYYGTRMAHQLVGSPDRFARLTAGVAPEMLKGLGALGPVAMLGGYGLASGNQQTLSDLGELFGRRAPKTAALYHGSSAGGLARIEPHPSHVLGGAPGVFATPDRDLALTFTAPWRDPDFEQGYINNAPYMREQYPGAFEKIYGGRSGTVYELPGQGFRKDPRLMREERVRSSGVAPRGAESVPDILAALAQTRFRLLKHDGAPYEYKRAVDAAPGAVPDAPAPTLPPPPAAAPGVQAPPPPQLQNPLQAVLRGMAAGAKPPAPKVPGVA